MVSGAHAIYGVDSALIMRLNEFFFRTPMHRDHCGTVAHNLMLETGQGKVQHTHAL